MVHDCAACKGLRYYCSWRALRVEAEDSSREVLQFACSFGVGEGTRDLIEHVSHGVYNTENAASL